MRAFIALELSEDLKNELARLEQELKAANADVKWVKPENIHLTLKFLGNVEEDKIAQIKKVLDDISLKNKPFEISLFKVGAFPTINNPRVIWIGIDKKGSSEVEALAEIIEGDLEKIGFSKEERPFSAHLTIGRVKSGRNKARLKEKLPILRVRPKSCAIDSITLFKSTLTPKGAIYTPLHVVKLRGAWNTR